MNILFISEAFADSSDRMSELSAKETAQIQYPAFIYSNKVG